MQEPEFTTYLKRAINDYAQDKVDAGNWQPSEALEKSRQGYQSLLPEGVSSKDNYLFRIENEQGTYLGMIWFKADFEGPKPTAFIYDFVIEEAYRRKGYGKQALLALEEKVKALEIDTLALHVFGHNKGARKLYEQVGYEITNINMAKKLS